MTEANESRNLGVKSLDQLTDEDITGMVFETLKEAEDFYMEYSKVTGFGIRRDDYGYNSKGEVVSRNWVCNREGKRVCKNVLNRQREPKAETRCGCRARFRVHKDSTTLRWVVTLFDREHNHVLIVPRQVRYVPCHRNISDGDATQIDSLSRAGVRTSHTIAVMKEQAGGFDKMGFTSKDVYNRNTIVRRSKVEMGDANAAFAYLRAKQGLDEQFFLEYSTDSVGHLEHMLWADGMSRLDFECFGDVLAFDSTYKTNVYARPFVVFSGVNHHKQTVVFAAAMLANEKIQAYVWALEMLVRCMNGRIPQTVVTDGDSSMRAAIEIVLPNATHRLCKWHLQRNAQSNVKLTEFTREFKKLARVDVSIHEWEAMWDEVIYRLGVEDNAWVKQLKRKREYWATAYLRGKFFCGITTTSRCEGVNAHIKRYLVQEYNLTEFMHHYDRALSHLREKETKADYETLHTNPVLTSTVRQLEHHASSIYSRAAFQMFRKQLDISNAIIFVEKEEVGDEVTYVFSKFGQPNSDRVVEFNATTYEMTCSCKRWESVGIPCAHMISTLKHQNIVEIPKSCILNRWTRNPKDWDSLSSEPEVSEQRLAAIRFGALVFSFKRVCHLASQSTDAFNEARKDAATLATKFEKFAAPRGHQAVDGILDPVIAKTKGCGRNKGKSTISGKRPSQRNQGMQGPPQNNT